MKGLHKIAFILLIVGGINWGLEFFGWGIASWGFIPYGLVKIVYLLVGISALIELFGHKGMCKECMVKNSA